jgi:hypothetical protein
MGGVVGTGQQGYSKKTQPDVPDYMGAAEQMGEYSQGAVEQQAVANHPNITTPGGSQQWTRDPTTGQWSLSMEYSPGQQAIYEGATGAAGSLLGSGGLGTPIDTSGLPELGTGEEARDEAERAIYERATSRLDPMWDQRQEQARTRLYNMGMEENDEGYDTAMGNLGRERTDAYSRAMQDAIIGGGQEASRTYGMDLSSRQQGWSELLGGRQNTLASLLGLSSIARGYPSMPGTPTTGAAQTPALLSALGLQNAGEWDQYNAEQAGKQGKTSGAMQILPFML